MGKLIRDNQLSQYTNYEDDGSEFYIKKRKNKVKKFKDPDEKLKKGKRKSEYKYDI